MMATWWVIEQDDLLSALCRVRDGDSPDIVLMELVANSNSEDVESDNG